MKKIAIALAAAAAVVWFACGEEEGNGTAEPAPVKEDTVLKLVSDAWDPCYSPDGNRLVFAEAYHLAIYNILTFAKVQLTPDCGRLENCPRAPVWLANDTVAFIRKDETSGAYNVYTIPATGGTVTKYEATTDAESSLAGDASGRYLYYTAPTEQLLYRLDLTTGERVKITGEHIIGYAHYDALAQPGTAYIYFAERMYPFNPSPHTDYISRVAGGEGGIPTLVFQSLKAFLPGLTVSPDDKYLVYPVEAGLYALEINTGVETWLTRSPNTWAAKDSQPAYAPDGRHLAFTRNNSVYCCDAP